MLFATMTMSVAVSGCSKSGSTTAQPVITTPSEPDPIDMSALTKAFESADSSAKLFCQEIMASVRGKDFFGALSQFKMLEKNPKLTAEQKQAIQDVIAKLETLNRR